MNNYKGINTDSSISEKSTPLSGQKKITLSEIKKLVKDTNNCQLLYDKVREKRNKTIKTYIKQLNTPNAVYSLAYEIKISPATIYRIIGN